MLNLKKSLTKKELIALVVAGTALIGYFSFADKNDPTSESKKQTPLEVHAEMTVLPTEGQHVICATPELLNEFFQHQSAGEKTKIAGMLQRDECQQMPSTGAFKVLSVKSGAVELVYAGSTGTEGVWAAKESVKPFQQ